MASYDGQSLPEPGVQAPRSSRRRSRWMTAGAVAGGLALALSACGSTSASAAKTASTKKVSSATKTANKTTAALKGLYGTLPKVGTPKSGGTITVGELKGDTPTYAMPIVPGADSSVYTIDDYIDMYNTPLYWAPVGATETIDQPLSLAELPVFSNGNKTITIRIKPWKWSNGTPITAENVVEYIDILKAAVAESAANYGNFSPGYFPQNVASATASGQVLTLHLTKAYNPTYYTDDQLDLLNALPPQWAITSTGGKPVDFANPAEAKLIYNYLNKQASDVATFGTNPLWKISDGPMIPSSFNATTGGFTMVPNTHYSGPQKVRFAKLDALVYTSVQAEFNNLEAGNLDMGGVDFSDLPSVGRIKGSYAVYGLPDFGFSYAAFNFADKTGDFNHIISQLYIRQALAHLVDQPGYIRGFYKGAAGADYGPIPAIPASPYAPASATSTPYPYSTATAASILRAHGWKVVRNGQTTCAKAGTAANECGAGIPVGTKLAFSWDYGNSPPVLGQQSVAFASAAKEVGINVSLKSETFNELIAKDDDPSSPSTENDWAVVDFGGFTQALYPTTNTIFNTSGTYNEGFYSNAEANTLIHNSVFGASTSAVTKEADYLTRNLPALFMPNGDLIIAVKKNVGGTPDSMLAQTQYTWEPQYWYLTK